MYPTPRQGHLCRGRQSWHTTQGSARNPLFFLWPALNPAAGCRSDGSARANNKISSSGFRMGNVLAGAASPANFTPMAASRAPVHAVAAVCAHHSKIVEGAPQHAQQQGWLAQKQCDGTATLSLSSQLHVHHPATQQLADRLPVHIPDG